jgi:hypothetical protein
LITSVVLEPVVTPACRAEAIQITSAEWIYSQSWEDAVTILQDITLLASRTPICVVVKVYAQDTDGLASVVF